MKKTKVIFAFLLLILCGCSSDETFVDTPTTDEEEITDDSTKMFKTEYADGEYTQPLYFGFELTSVFTLNPWITVYIMIIMKMVREQIACCPQSMIPLMNGKKSTLKFKR